MPNTDVKIVTEFRKTTGLLVTGVLITGLKTSCLEDQLSGVQLSRQLDQLSKRSVV